ncbi:MAG: hypothetical protein QXL16_02090 [Candidatus Micrarchaeaceae archaeon]
MRSAFLFILLLVPLLYSYSLEGLVQEYNISLNNTQHYNVSIGNYNYSILVRNNSVFVVINLSSGSILTNEKTVFAAIKGFLISKYLPLANFSRLNILMHEFQESSQASINDCLNETGLGRGLTCTIANNCNSCQTVPDCSLVLYKTDGPAGPLGRGIMQFESQYANLTSNFSKFYASTSGVNESNVEQKISYANSAFANISNLSYSITENPMLGIPSSVTSSQISQCINYPNPATAPWYCEAVGFCGNEYGLLTYNYSILNEINQTLQEIDSLPLTYPAISFIAANATNNGIMLFNPFIQKEKEKELDSILNTTLSNYSSLVSNAESLLQEVESENLSRALSLLKGAYENLTSNYLSLNLTSFNLTLRSYMSALESNYTRLNETYASILSLAYKNSFLSLYNQLKSPSMKNEINSLNLSIMDSELGSRISNATSFASSELSISNSFNPPQINSFGLPKLIASTDKPFADAIAYGLSLPFPLVVTLFPLFSALFSLIIGLIITGFFYFAYLRLKLYKRIHMSRRVRRNWMALFGILISLSLIYALITYFVASYYNSHGSIDLFIQAVRNSKYAAIFSNYSNPIPFSQALCESEISASLRSRGKVPLLVEIRNDSCILGNESVELNKCLAFYSYKSIPMFFISNASPELYIYSGSAYAMYYSGNDTIISSCIPSLFVR